MANEFRSSDVELFRPDEPLEVGILLGNVSGSTVTTESFARFRDFTVTSGGGEVQSDQFERDSLR